MSWQRRKLCQAFFGRKKKNQFFIEDRLIEKRRQIRHLQRWDFELEEAIERLEDLKKEGIVETIQNEEDGEDEGLYANQIEGEQNKTKMGENN